MSEGNIVRLFSSKQTSNEACRGSAEGRCPSEKGCIGVLGSDLLYVSSLSTGQKWKDMRSTLTPAFTSSKMKMLFTLMSETSKQLTVYLENRLREQESAAEHKPVSYYAN
jgi:cytochrome P450